GTVAAYETAEGEPDGGWATGVAGGETRFQVFARFHSPRRKLGVTVKADLDDESPAVASIHDIFYGAEWHERETWEMYGFVFEGHPDLRHIYLPGEFEGFPLRKDFPLLAREVKPWPGLVDVEDLGPDVVCGYMHRGYEKLTEVRTYPQITTLVNRIDWLSSFANEVPFILAAEKLMEIEAPPRAQYIRTILFELARIA